MNTSSSATTLTESLEGDPTKSKLSGFVDSLKGLIQPVLAATRMNDVAGKLMLSSSTKDIKEAHSPSQIQVQSEAITSALKGPLQQLTNEVQATLDCEKRSITQNDKPKKKAKK